LAAATPEGPGMPPRLAFIIAVVCIIAVVRVCSSTALGIGPAWLLRRWAGRRWAW